MIDARDSISKRIRLECSHLLEIEARIHSEWQKFIDTQDDSFIDAVALNLQAYYTGIEKILVWILRSFGMVIPQGSNWHLRLLESAVYDKAASPFGVLSAEQKELLDRYRAFRHVARNVYSFNFDPKKICVLVEKLHELTDSLVSTFCQVSDLMERELPE